MHASPYLVQIYVLVLAESSSHTPMPAKPAPNCCPHFNLRWLPGGNPARVHATLHPPHCAPLFSPPPLPPATPPSRLVRPSAPRIPTSAACGCRLSLLLPPSPTLCLPPRAFQPCAVPPVPPPACHPLPSNPLCHPFLHLVPILRRIICGEVPTYLLPPRVPSLILSCSRKTDRRRRLAARSYCFLG